MNENGLQKEIKRAAVPSHQRAHYARWVRQFAKSAAGKLTARSPQEVQAYLAELNELPHLERW